MACDTEGNSSRALVAQAAGHRFASTVAEQTMTAGQPPPPATVEARTSWAELAFAAAEVRSKVEVEQVEGQGQRQAGQVAG